MEQNLNDQDSVYDPAEDWVVQDEVSESESHRVVSHEVQTESVRPKSTKKLLFSESQYQPAFRGQETYIKEPLVRGGVQELQREYGSYRVSPGDIQSQNGIYYRPGSDYSMGYRPPISMFEPVTVNGESQSPYRRGYNPTAHVPNVDQNLRFPPGVNNPLDYDVLNRRFRHFPPGKAKPCPSYDGKSSFRDFLIQFEMIGEYNQWSLNVMASQLAMCLKDQAVAVLADLSPFQRRHYDSLVAALRERFEPDNQSQLHRAQLKSRIRRENEPLPQLAHDIRRLVRDANPGVPLDIRENMAKDSFLDALNDRELELAVFQSQPKTMQDALKTAIEIEAFHRSRDRRLPLRSLKETKCVNDTENVTVQELQVRIAKLEEELKLANLSQVENAKQGDSSGSKSSQKSKRKVVCYYCDKPGHVVKDCRKKQWDKKKKEERDSLNKQQLK